MSDTKSSGQATEESHRKIVQDAEVKQNNRLTMESILISPNRSRYLRDRLEVFIEITQSKKVENKELDIGCSCTCGVQLLSGAAVGGLVGYLESYFTEPFGIVMGGSLLALHALDMDLSWSGRTHKRLLDRLGWAAAGFLAGYVSLRE